jgi:hypothetical protein
MPFDFDYGAIWSYNRLRLLQPQVEEHGLYKTGETYQILCPNLDADSKASDETPLLKWFNRMRQILTPIALVRTLSVGAVRMRELTSVEIATCTGAPRTLRDVYASLAVELPADFPSYYIQDETGAITVVVSRALSEDENRRLQDTIDRLKLSVSYSITQSQVPFVKGDEFQRAPQADIDLLPARSAKARGWSKELCDLIRRDEEAWMEHRGQLSRLSAREVLPSGSFASSDARCLVNAATFPTEDIRNHLSIYQKVAIIAPLASHATQFYGTAKVTEDEVVELARMGRVEFVCPQAVDRYPISLLEKLSSTAPHALLFSRRLALATAADCRQRVPLLYPDLAMKDRAELLRGLLKGLGKVEDTKQRVLLEALIRDIGRIWNDAAELLNRRGAMANAALGIALPMTKMFDAAGLPSRQIELMSAAMAVEWAAAIGATIQPIETPTYSERSYTEVLANLYTGLKYNDVPRMEPTSNVHVKDLLAIGREVPVIDFAKSFTGSDIDRLRGCIRGISQHHYQAEEAQAIIVAFNKEVERYAGNKSRIERWDIAGLVLTVGGTVEAKPVAAVTTAVSLGLWIFSRIKKLIDAGTIKEPIIVDWADKVTATLYRTNPDSVLVHRIRKRLKG